MDSVPVTPHTYEDDWEPQLEVQGCAYYAMNHRRRGVAALFNNMYFESNVFERKESKVDMTSLSNTFALLGFQVERHHEMRLGELDSTLLDLSHRNHEDCDCLVIVFMTHELKGKLRARDEFCDIDLIWRYFSAELCPSLAGKPKLFFVHTSQVSEKEKGDPEQSEELEESSKGVELVPSYVLPNQSDILICLSTIPDFVSIRTYVTGSWYIQTLCKQLDRHGFTKNLLDILTDVARVLALEYSFILFGPRKDSKKQPPPVISLLRKLVKFQRKNFNMKKRKRDDDTQVSEDGESSTEGDIEKMDSVPVTAPTDEDDGEVQGCGYYAMNHHRRGVAAIFNNRCFESSVSERQGSELDVSSLCTTFGRLGFEVETHQDLCLAELDSTLLALSRRNHEDCDCLVIVFMTHGLKGKLRARDQIFDIDLLWHYWKYSSECPSLAGKPKLFFVQSCQGSEMLKGVRIRDPEESDELEESSKGIELAPSYVLPNQSDILISLSTIPGCVSWRSPDKGSWYIQTLCKQLDQFGFTEHLLNILTNVARIVALRYSYLDLRSPPEDAIKKQLPPFITLLTKLVKFQKKNVNIQKRKRDDDTQVSEDGESSTEREIEVKRTKTK